MSELQPTVFIVDSDADVQRTLRDLMESVRLHVETYFTTEAFIEQYDPSRRGCLILEVRMKGMSGIELFHRLKAEGSRIPVIFLTKHGDIPMAVEAMREGAFHFLQKPCSQQYLLDQTHAAIALDMRHRREEMEQRRAVAHFESLSAREREVLGLILGGKTNKTMARQLGVTVKTVEFHRANIMRKARVDNVVELVCLLLRSGWKAQVRRAPACHKSGNHGLPQPLHGTS